MGWLEFGCAYACVCTYQYNNTPPTPSPRENGATPLLHAAGKGRVDVVRALLSAGADVNLAMKDGRSALFQGERE